MDDECRTIQIDQLHDPWVVMRPVVKDSIEYLERRDSIATDGVLNSILVRPSTRQPGKYEIVDGFWRYTAALETDVKTIPCIIRHGLTDREVLALQIKANAIRRDTTRTEYARQLKRLFEKTEMSISELAKTSGKNVEWLRNQLDLLELSKEMQLMVDRGEIPIQSAYMLAKIPPHWRAEQVNNARTMSAREFKTLAAGLVKKFMECVQQGKMDVRWAPEFKPQPHVRGIKEFKSELENPQVGAILIAAENCKTLLSVWNLCLRWALHLDNRSVEEQRVKFIDNNRSTITRKAKDQNLEE